jgi:type IV pilus assembly protein PilM
MPSSNVCWGIEVGAGGIKALKLERDGESVKVVDFAVIPHKKVLSTPDLDQVDAIRVGLGALVSQYDLKKATIAISIPGHSAFARFAKLPPVEPKKIPSIVEFEARQQIPFPIEEVEWDFQTFTNQDSPDVEVGIFAVTRERVMEKLAQWQDVGVTPDIVNLSPISVFNAIAYDMAFTDKTPGTVLLDVGTTSTDLVVAEAGRVWVRTFPIGGHQFTEALVEAFKLTYPKAEKLKREAETSKHARHVFQAMRPIFSDLAQEVQRSIGFYQSSHREANLTRLVVLGSTFNLPGLKKYLGQQLQMEVVQLGSFNRPTIEGPRSGEFQAATLNMATAYGLALQGLGLAAIDANLMPVAVLREAMWKGKVKWFAAAAALSVIAGGLSFTRFLMDKTALESNPPSSYPIIQQTKSELARLKGDWQAIDSGFQPDYSAANASLLLENREVIPWIIDDLGNVMAVSSVDAAKTAAAGKDPQGLVFQKFTTVYTSAGADADTGYGDFAGSSAAPERGTSPMTSKGGGRGADRGQTPPAAPPPTPPAADPNAPAAAPTASEDGPKFGLGEGPPRVIITLTVKTTREDPFEFISRTAQKWLSEHKERDAAPFSIKHVEWKLLTEEMVAKDPNAPQGQGTSAPGGITRPGQRGTEDRGRPGAVRPPPGFENPDDYVPPDDIVRGYTRPGEGTAGGGAGGDVNQLAPLPKAPAVGEPGAKVRTFEIKWEAYLKAGKPATEGGA